MTGSRYATNTSVSASRTIQEIQETLLRFGCSRFVMGTETEPVPRALIGFTKGGIPYRIAMSLPMPNERDFTHTPTRGSKRTEAEARQRWEQRTREKWRSLGLWVKAMVVAVEDEITTFETVFLPFMLGPGNQTVAEVSVPQALCAAAEGRLPDFDIFGPGMKALPEGSERRP